MIGNEDECAAIAKAFGLPENSTPIDSGKAIVNYKNSRKTPRTAILTHGGDPTVVVTGTAEGGIYTKEYPIPPIAKEEFGDTNGAGDSFVGGFLSALYNDKSFDECINAGTYFS